jgi:hypothetical protein
MLILVPKQTNRLRYTIELVFGSLLNIDYELTTDVEKFKSWNEEKFHYGNAPIGDEPFQKAIKLLFEREIVEQSLKPFDFEDVKGIFPVFSPNSLFPFDILAASFYIVSRYEEYLPQVRDRYGRFKAETTCMYEMGMLQKPLVNILAMKILERFQKTYPDLQAPYRSFKFVPTYDIDAAWAYRHKGLFRTLGAYAKNIVMGDFDEIERRNRVLFKHEKDPFDTFEYQFSIQKEYNLKPIYFILCGDYDTNDKNISIRNNAFRNLIKQLGDHADVGIHPSFSSYLDSARLEEEKDRLANVLNRSITKSRQHFLRMNLPRSYQRLIELDITDDYTMGFASQAGFRAGIADTFRFYDLENDVATNLRIHPFALMDGTMRDYLDLDVNKSYKMATRLIDEVKAVNGTFILLWHNETLGGEKRWKGWSSLYRRIVEYAMKK